MRQLRQFSVLTTSIKHINTTLLINSILIEPSSLWTLIQLTIYIMMETRRFLEIKDISALFPNQDQRLII